MGVGVTGGGEKRGTQRRKDAMRRGGGGYVDSETLELSKIFTDLFAEASISYMQ